jgi:Membrane bound FAD containing D-sorbitol dehydrogenase
MTYDASDGPIASALAVDLSRRRFLAQGGAWAALAAAATRLAAQRAGAQEATPVDQAKLQSLLDLSKTLCGGGNFDPDRGTLLLQLLSSDPSLAAGLDELLASPPVEGTPVAPQGAQATAQAILVYWYVGAFDGDPVPDRSTAYYGLTAWQAMYTPPFAVCKAYGAWADPPQEKPLVANS